MNKWLCCRGEILKKILVSLYLVFAYAVATPTIGNFYFDGSSVLGNSTISNKPVITIEVAPGSGLSIIVANFHFYIDGEEVLTTSPQNYSYDAINNIFRYVVTDKLSGGMHSFRIVANDGADSEATQQAFVASDEFTVVGDAHAYPSPATSNVTIGYTLSCNGDLDLTIYNLAGEMVYKRIIEAGTPGGKSAYNAVEYDLHRPDHLLIPNGVYICLLVGKENGKRSVLGKTKFFVLR
jgi:hypothetical protein